MIDWFKWLTATYQLDAETAAALRTDGFAVVEGPLRSSQMEALAAAYDQTVNEASGPDKSVGRTTTRLHDLVNRGEAFDKLYLHPPVLAASCQTIGRPFKLSNMLARTVHPRTDAQALHADFPRDQDGWPMLGFIVMVDEFTPRNGATQFARGSHHWAAGAPAAVHPDLELVPACGPRGAMLLYNGSVIHGHGPNRTERPRRSIQGAFIRREATGFGLAGRMSSGTRERIGPLAEYLIAG